MELKEGMTPGGKRTPLRDVLPLDTPYLIQVFPVYACNFHCNFCLHALDRSKHGYISDTTLMDLVLYKKCIDDMKQFPRKLKMLRFAAIGEPLLHPQITDMIAYAKQAGIADSVDIVTNGSLLTHELSEKLIDSGLDRLRISVDGISDESFA
ncbi:MAG: radical SAM protein, partial [Ruminiclostridium sp.]|nr:radical SAM protein [Ruminiclostridium sp.]